MWKVSAIVSNIRVLPIIDLNTGQVQFTMQGQWAEFYTDRPQELLRLLSRSTDTTYFTADSCELWIATGKQRVTNGERIAFSLAKFHEPSTLITLGGDGKPPSNSAIAPYRV